MTLHAWDHDQWELWGVTLVRECYGHEYVVDVPDNAGGDHGIECYTRSGIAFQCYSSENEPLTPTRRGALQKDKIRKDIKKFINGGASLQALLGSVKIHTWVLLTPYHQDASVIGYCNEKALEVDAAGLDYAENPFSVTVHHLDTYRTEHDRLTNRQALADDLQRGPDVEVPDFANATSELIERMDTKLARLPGLDDDRRRAKVRSALLVEQIQGASLLDRWRDRVPEVATHLQHVLATEKNQLELSAVGVPGPEDRFQAVRADVLRSIRSDGALTPINAQHVADMAIADWLQECSLDFFPAQDL